MYIQYDNILIFVLLVRSTKNLDFCIPAPSEYLNCSENKLKG